MGQGIGLPFLIVRLLLWQELPNNNIEKTAKNKMMRFMFMT